MGKVCLEIFLQILDYKNWKHLLIEKQTIISAAFCSLANTILSLFYFYNRFIAKLESIICSWCLDNRHKEWSMVMDIFQSLLFCNFVHATCTCVLNIISTRTLTVFVVSLNVLLGIKSMLDIMYFPDRENLSFQNATRSTRCCWAIQGNECNKQANKNCKFSLTLNLGSQN